MRRWIILLMLPICQLWGSEFRHVACVDRNDESQFIWEQVNVNPFDELILSWNANRPNEGNYLIQVSLLVDEWSPWLNYAYWGAQDQYSFHEEKQDLKSFQDAVEVSHGKKSTGFRVRVLAENGATLEGLSSLHACLTEVGLQKMEEGAREGISIDLDVPGLSQIALNDAKSMRICSPTSTTAALNYLKKSSLNPLQFAEHVRDSAFDIFGNWVLNTAQASHELGPSWECYVAKFTSFNQIIDQLVKGTPVVVSIRGPLPGSALPYESGHLIVIRGYDSEKQAVLCMDPAFPTNAQTKVSYKLEDFLTAWNKRLRVAYIFNKKTDIVKDK